MELYYTDKKNINQKYLSIVGREAHHISKVMRHKVGDILFVTDGQNNEYQTMIKSLEKNYIKAEIINRTRQARETTVKITLAQSIIKANKMEFIIEKTTELGVNEIIPIKTERTITSVSEKKAERYRNIMLAAMKTSTRTYFPLLSKSISFDKLLDMTSYYDLALIAWEQEKTNRLLNVIPEITLRKILLIIGPEGGFTEREIQEARICGVKCFSLGTRRLRAETAALSALSLLLYELKEM